MPHAAPRRLLLLTVSALSLAFSVTCVVRAARDTDPPPAGSPSPHLASQPAAERPFADPATHLPISGTTSAFHNSIAARYNYFFGHDAPFLPSNATSANGQFLDPKSFPTAEYCGHCHQEAHKQWRQTAHANSFRAPWYLKNVNQLIDEKGVQFSRHCEGCHNPVALLSGDLSQGMPKKRPFEDEGVTCSVCHSIVAADTTGTGSYILGTPAVLVDENGAPLTRPVSDAEILAHLDRHSKAVMRPLYKSAEFCAACHKAAIPHTLDDYKWLRAFTVYDEWQGASFTKQSPLPFYRKDSVSTCQTCHMPREPLAPAAREPGAKDNQFATHRWLGGNTLIPAYYHYDDQSRRTASFLQQGHDGKGVLNVDIFAIEKGPNAAQSAGSEPKRTAVQDTGLTGTSVKGTDVKGTGLTGTGVQGAGPKGAGLKGTDVKGTGFSPYIEAAPQVTGALAPEGPASVAQSSTLIAPLGLVPASFAPGDTLVADVVIQNKGIAHSLVPEQRDFYEAWVDFTVKDASGKTLVESGFLRPDGHLDPSAHSFTNRLINVKGELNGLHEIWHNRVLAYNNALQSGRSQLVRYRFRLPRTLKGGFTLTATVRYRRFNQHFIDYAMEQKPGDHFPQPIVDMASNTRTFKLGDNAPEPASQPCPAFSPNTTGTVAVPASAQPPAPRQPAASAPRPAQPSVSGHDFSRADQPAKSAGALAPAVCSSPAENPEWMRWNNYGIALLDALQYQAAVDAFQHVARLRPDYADAWTNQAIVEIAWERYADAAPNLERALQLLPGDPRALFYRALVERFYGRTGAAIADFQAMLAKYPRAKDGLRELGFSYFQQHNYAAARDAYERLQAIDPDDLAAHYQLAILYRRLGEKEKSAAESAKYKDQKDDPPASVYALQFLGQHPEVAAESVPWHAHDLTGDPRKPGKIEYHYIPGAGGR